LVDGFTDVPAMQLSFTYNQLIFKPDTIIAPNKNPLDLGPGLFNLSEPGLITLLAIVNNAASYNNGDTLFILCGTFIGKAGSTLNIQPDINKIDVLPRDPEEIKINLCPIEITPRNNEVTPILKICGTSLTGAMDGTINIRGAGGQAPYTFVVTKDGNNIAQGMIVTDTTLSLLSSGIYNITITDANGIMVTETRRVNDNDRIRLNNFDIGPTAQGVINPLCRPGVQGTRHQTGRISLTSKVGEYSFSWSNNSYNYGNGTSLSMLETGIYSVTITDDNTGCFVDTSFTLTAPDYSVSYDVIDKFLCYDDGLRGTIKINPLGGTPINGSSQYRYRITTTAGVGARRLLPSDGSFQIETNVKEISIFDANDCELKIDLRDRSGELLFPKEEFSLNTDSLLLQCPETMDINFFLSVNNESGRLLPQFIIKTITNLDDNSTFSNSTPVFNGNFTPGAYKISTGDRDGKCPQIFDFHVIRPSEIIHVVNVEQPSCSDTMGYIEVNSSGGTGPFTYVWEHDNSITSSRLDSLTQGTFKVMVRDAKDCGLLDTTITIIPSTLVTLDSIVVLKEIECGRPGTIGAFTSSPNATYSWSNGSTNQFINPAEPGMYIVSVKIGECDAIDSIEIRELSNIEVSLANKIDAACSSGPNSKTGSIQLVNVTGATGQFTRSWFKEGQQTEVALNVNQIQNLDAGTYRLKITDETGCIKEEFFTIESEIDSVFIDLDELSVTTIQCQGRNNGEAMASASGGLGSDYRISWSTGEIGNQANNLVGGSNWVVASHRGCFSDTIFFNVNQVAPLEVLKNVVDPTCREAADGRGSIEIVGKAADYEILWTTISKTGPRYDSLKIGAYPIAIRNINDINCIIFDTIQVTKSGEFSIGVDSVLTSLSGCGGGIPAGQVALKILNGSGPVNYSLNGNMISGGIARGLSAGTYDFIGINSKGCLDTIRGFTLLQNEPVQADFANIDSILCNGAKTCIRLSNVRGGSGTGYTYAVNFSRNIPIDSCFEVFSGRYRINVFDSEGCGDSLEITIGQPERFEISLGDDLIYQLGGTKPTISVTPNSGSSIINVNWSNPNFIQCTGDNCQEVQVQEYANIELIADAVNQNGCIARGRIKLTLNEKENVFIPSVLKTDGQVSDFENTRWKITIGEGVESIKTLKILDRWGNIVHTMENINNDYEGWDGLYNGRELPPGVYVYVAEIEFVPTNEQSKSRIYSGSITLLR
jgi:gliding motility-associated-like protein